MKTKTLKIKPDVLKSLRFYARQKKPMVLEHFQKKARLRYGVDGEYLKSIETSEHELDMSLVKEFAKLYKFPISCFLLPKPLKDDLVPPDYRKVPASQKGIVSPKGAIALRTAQRAQYVINLIQGVPIDDRLPKLRLQSDIETVAFKVRHLLPKSFRTQEKSSNPYKLFTALRNELEELGIVVLKLSFPTEDARAFSLTNEKPYVIVVNNKDGTEQGYSPKVFSLMHELGHILLRDGGLCNDFTAANKVKQELFCNELAAASLIPADDLKNELDRQNFSILSQTNRIDLVDDLRKKYLISGEVLIRRIHGLNSLTWDEKEYLLTDWNTRAAKYRKDGFIPRLTESQKCVGRNGKYYTQSVFDGVSRGALTPENATSYLGIKLKHFYDLKKSIPQ